MQETTPLVQTCKCIYECKYLHINVLSSLFSRLKNLSQPWNREKTITITSGTCVKCRGVRLELISEAKQRWCEPHYPGSWVPCVRLLLSRLRRVSSYLHFQVGLIFSRRGSSKYMEGFFAEFCANTLGLYFRSRATIKLFFTWIEGWMTHY